MALALNSLGSNFYYIALPLLVFKLSQSAASMGLMGIIEVLPIIILGPFIGAIIDKSNKRIILICSTIVQIIVIIFIFFVGYFEQSSMYIYILGGIIAINVQIYKVSIFSITPYVYGENLKVGNAKISSITTITELSAPFIASLIILMTGVESIFIFNIGTLIIFGFIIYREIKIDEEKKKSKIGVSNIIKDVKDGFMYIFNIRAIRVLVIIVALSNLADAGLIQLLMFYLGNDFGLGDSKISFIIGISGIGAFIGTFVPQRFKNLKLAKMLFYGLIINNIGILFLLIKSWIMVGVALFICNIGAVIYLIAQNTIIQTIAEKNMLGRLNSSIKLLTQITKPISLAILMFTANNFGSYKGILISVLLTIVTTFVIIVSRIYEYKFDKVEEFKNENCDNKSLLSS
ncbi:MFS transporter [Clostridium sp.]|uniref:MFS transporter n=1 Tax=Clostridium sp. TaxID=1506 RepID=UPI003F3D569C